MTKEEYLKKSAELDAVVIHEPTESRREGAFQPPLSRRYDRGVATLKDGRKVEFAWGLNLSMESVKAIHALQPEREFVYLGMVGIGNLRGNYAPILLDSEK